MRTSVKPLRPAIGASFALLITASCVLATALPESRRAAAEPVQPSAVVSSIQLAGRENVREDVIRDALTLKPGGAFSAAQLEADRKAVLALGYFRSVSASQQTADGQTEITFKL